MLLRHLAAALGASHLGRSAAGIIAGVWGGWAVLCALFGEMVFLSGTIYAYHQYPAGTGSKGSPKQGPVELMSCMLLICTVGFLLGGLGYRRRSGRYREYRL